MFSSSDYKTCLIKFKLLPFMHILDINDIMFFYYQFEISYQLFQYYLLLLDSPAKQVVKKMQHIRKSDNHSCNCYFQKLLCIWNALPIILVRLVKNQK